MLVFLTAIKHPSNSQSYDDVWRLLNNTLFSVCSQSDQKFRVIVVCDKKLPLFHHQEIINKYTDFIEVDFPSHGDEVIQNFNRLGKVAIPVESPKRWKQWSQDTKKSPFKMSSKLLKFIRKLRCWNTNKSKRQQYMSKEESKLMANYALNRGSKQLISILAAKKYNPEYVLIFDADDYVGSDISSYVNANPGENGWIMSNGYKLMDNLISPFYSKNSFCGTGNILNYSLLQEIISPEVNEKSTQNELFENVNSEFLIILARHGKVRSYFEKKGRPFLSYPTRSAVHLLGHEESNDFLRRTIRGEPASLRLETAQKFSGFAPISPDLVHYFNILPKNTQKIFCVDFIRSSTNPVQTIFEDLGYQVSRSYRKSENEFWKKLEQGDHSEIKQASKMFDAFHDAPWFLYYKEFDHWYPDSKFILTELDDHSWWISFKDYFKNEYKPLTKYIFGIDNPVGNKEVFIQNYKRHNSDVIEYFKERPDDLLVVNPKEKNIAQKISTFLGKSPPNEEIPQANERRRALIHNSIENKVKPKILPINTHLIRTNKAEGKAQEKINFSSKLNQMSLGYQKIGDFITRRSFYPSDKQYNLSISEDKKFVWYRVGKVGTRTILDVFNQANVALSAEHPYDIYYPVNVYKEYFKFAFVRNPWDRLVSHWQNKVVDRNLYASNIELLNFENYIGFVSSNINLEYGNGHLRLQCKLIDLNHIDFLGRFETFEEDLEEVMDIIGIEGIIKKKNVSKRKKDYREYYTASTKDKVAELYKRDISIFKYEF
jgi:hypothetical protein